MGEFTIKDSGKRHQFESGMVRDATEGKTDYLLVRDGPMYRRWAEHLTKGAIKYDRQNWMKAAGEEEKLRFRLSAARHFEQWLAGETDEDHAAAVFFNINGVEYVKRQESAQSGSDVTIPPLDSPELQRRPVGGEPWCNAIGPQKPGYCCERVLGHPGQHRAWSNYDRRQTYNTGVWA